MCVCVCVGRDSSVGIATRYGLDGLGIESRWGAGFSVPVQTGPGSTQPPVRWVPGLSRVWLLELFLLSILMSQNQRSIIYTEYDGTVQPFSCV
jgi:hypothetical protein